MRKKLEQLSEGQITLRIIIIISFIIILATFILMRFVFSEFGAEIKDKYCLDSNLDNLSYLARQCEKITTYQDSRYPDTYACIFDLKAVDSAQYNWFEFQCHKWGNKEDWEQIVYKDDINKCK